MTRITARIRHLFALLLEGMTVAPPRPGTQPASIHYFTTTKESDRVADTTGRSIPERTRNERKHD